MVDFSIAELRILQEHKGAWKGAKQKQDKTAIFRQIVHDAQKLPETRKMGKQEWATRKKVWLLES